MGLMFTEERDSDGRHVVVGMSGGVDSAVTAHLLKQQGYQVTGLFMKNWEDDDDDQYCSSRQDLVDVASVCDVLGIDLEVVNFSKEYKERDRKSTRLNSSHVRISYAVF